MSIYLLIGADIIKHCVKSAKKHGNGCNRKPILCSLDYTEKQKNAIKQIEWGKMILCTIVDAFRFGECSSLYAMTFAEDKGDSRNAFTNTLYRDFSKPICFIKNSEINLQITHHKNTRLMETFFQVMDKSVEVNIL